VLGLAAGTAYDFQVQPLNRGVPGPPSQLLGIKTANRPDDPPGVPGPVPELRIEAPMRVSSVSIAWAVASNNPDAYVIQYRLHDSAESWRSQTVKMTRMTIDRLGSGAQYDIRVAAKNAAGQGSWTSVLVYGTARSPEWADLIVSGDGPGEVDVTRVQMLLFTIVTALFVMVTVATDYQIPTIPNGFIILMGISNGLYVGSKFVPG
jgi:hypothetical protein